MTGAELIAAHAAILEKMANVCEAKNSDYAGTAGAQDAFANFRMIEKLSGGSISTESGMLTRMSDKFSRLMSLVASGNEQKVKDESVEDTLIDLANYAILLAIYRKDGKVG